jgi:hypothetical protein
MMKRSSQMTTMDVRDRVLTSAPSDLGIDPGGNIWAVLMETAYKAGIATLVALADGSAHLLFSTGGAVANDGSHDEIHDRTKRLLSDAEGYLAVTRAEPVRPPPHPEVGTVRFYLLTPTEVRTTDAPEEALERKQHHLAPLFYSAHRVITQLRLMEQARTGGPPS